MSQGAFLLAFLWLLALASRTALPGSAPPVSANLFQRLSPLSALTSSAAARALVSGMVPALALLALALVAGRAFCGWVCPLGTTIDLSDRVLAPLRGRPRPAGLGPRTLKVGLLAALLALALLGANLAGLFDPLSLVTLGYTTVAQPAALALLEHAVGALPEGAVRSAALRLESALRAFPLSTALPPGRVTAYAGWWAVAAAGGLILGLGAVSRRAFCRYACPAGALLGLLGRRAPLRRRVDEAACTRCGLCEQGCRMTCIVEEGRDTLAGECILCGDCAGLCPRGAVVFSFRGAGGRARPVSGTRRAFLVGAASALAAFPALVLSRSARRDLPRLVRPPGAAPGDEFLDLCIRCGACMKACPTGGLHPSVLQGSLEDLFTPVLVPRLGPCEYNCNACGRVCPTGALERLGLEEKRLWVMGKARIHTGLCIPWSRGEECLVCEEVCPVPGKAIRFEPGYGAAPNPVERLPYVVESECIGCGNCEYHCPVAGEAAIRVIGVAPQERGFKGGVGPRRTQGRFQGGRAPWGRPGRPG